MCKDGKRTLSITHGMTNVKGGVYNSLRKSDDSTLGFVCWIVGAIDSPQ